MTAALNSGVMAVAGILVAMAGAGRACALGFEAFGPAEAVIGRSPDWPQGVEKLMQSPARVYWHDVNGNEAAYFDGDIATVNKLLELYSQVDLARRLVVIRPGRPSAKSFEGTLTPHVVEFAIPSGIALIHFQQFADTGLFPVAPRLNIFLDAELAENLADLKIPANVLLDDAACRVEDAVAHANDEDLTVRYRAIVALGDATDPTSAGLAALMKASRDDNESIRTAGTEALAQVTAAKEPAELALRTRLSKFVRSHPQYIQSITPEKLLEALRAVDTEYAKGFTARGTLVEPTALGAGKLVAWTITMGDGKLVLEQRDVEDADHPPAPGRFEYVNYAGQERMGSVHGYRTWVDGKLSEMKPDAMIEPVGSTYDLLIGRVLWPLGRGYSRRIDRITKITASASGTLAVVAECDDGNLMRTWELQVDPSHEFLVRSAKAYPEEGGKPEYVVDAVGVMSGGGRSTSHTARWIEGAARAPTSIAVTSVSAMTDAKLIDRTETRLNQLPGLGQ